ncbi:MAG: 50S ribosomal protein L35 [Proteobacteria bacterium]|nr:50S ribosomal protein L35 [Pseudomonadota bacterium]
MAGYKLKTKSSAKKRFKMTSNGKIKRKKAKLRHMLTRKNAGTKRGLRKSGLIDSADAKSVKRMLPYA